MLNLTSTHFFYFFCTKKSPITILGNFTLGLTFLLHKKRKHIESSEKCIPQYLRINSYGNWGSKIKDNSEKRKHQTLDNFEASSSNNNNINNNFTLHRSYFSLIFFFDSTTTTATTTTTTTLDNLTVPFWLFASKPPCYPLIAKDIEEK